MKKIYFFLFSFIFLPALKAQISIEKVHMIETSRTVVFATDHSTRAIPHEGEDTVWNYTNLKTNLKDSMRFGLAAWYPGSEYFPNANRAYIRSTSQDSFHFQLLSDDGLYEMGLSVKDGNNIDAFRLKLKILGFPSYFGKEDNDAFRVLGNSFPVKKDIDSTGPLPYIDSLRIDDVFSAQSIITGSGKITTPLGQFDCIQQKLLQQTAQQALVLSNGSWDQAPPVVMSYYGLTLMPPLVNSSIRFWVPSAYVGVPILECKFEPGIDSVKDMRWVIVEPHVNSIQEKKINTALVYPNPFSQVIFFKNEFEGQVSLYDANGKLVLNQDNFKSNELDLSSLNAAIYFLILRDSEGRVQNYRISKLN